MNTVLLSGACGYVGQKVRNYFENEGVRVIGLDRIIPSDCTGQILQADLARRDELFSKLDNLEIDGIVHLASLPGDTGKPYQMLDVNVYGLLNLLEWSRKNDIKKFVSASSISAYEWYPATPFHAPDELPVPETHHCRPQDMYSTTKRMQELLLLTYFHEYKLPACALRFAAVVGPAGKGGGRSWLEFAAQMRAGKEIDLPFFKEDEVCHFVDVRDVARMCFAAYEHPSAVGEIFNCAGPAPTKGSELSEIVKNLVPGIEVRYGYPWSMAQGGKIWFDMGKAERLLGYKPVYDMKSSIENIYQWACENDLQAVKTEEEYGAGVEK